MSPVRSPSWANTSCCPPKGHCLNDRWKGCEDKRSFISPQLTRGDSFHLRGGNLNARENGVVEYPRQGVVNVAHHMAEMLA